MKVERGLKVGWFRLIWFDAVVREVLYIFLLLCFFFFFFF